MLPEQDRERLLHIQDAAEKINQFLIGCSEEDFRRNELLQYGVIHCLYIIGEAATRVSEATRTRYPAIEWDLIRGLRNRLAHAYFNLNLDLLWYSASVETPRLLEAIIQILATE